jgi:hypothetical protein
MASALRVAGVMQYRPPPILIAYRRVHTRIPHAHAQVYPASPIATPVSSALHHLNDDPRASGHEAFQDLHNYSSSHARGGKVLSSRGGSFKEKSEPSYEREARTRRLWHAHTSRTHIHAHALTLVGLQIRLHTLHCTPHTRAHTYPHTNGTGRMEEVRTRVVAIWTPPPLSMPAPSAFLLALCRLRMWGGTWGGSRACSWRQRK